MLRELRDAIRSGEYQPGERLPTVDDLMERYSMTSRPAVQKVLAALASEGLVVTVHRRGSYVREYSPIDWHPGAFEHRTSRRDIEGAGQDAWAADVAAQGRVPRQEIVVETAPAPDSIAARLDLARGTEVAVRRRLRLVDDTPFQTADSYYPLWVAEGTPIMSPGDIAIPGGLMAAAGHPQVRFRDEIVVRMPDPDEQARLSLPPGTPVAEHTRTGFNSSKRPVRVIVTIAPGDRHRIIYEVSGQ
ncbi:GntR family transcriptional regulator [Dactylosporangium sucinum]|uniref:GntR family transcriptional regulator n=1 Tax=Dactylosporangium sucinum TaxID=1424081 RepID=UPI00167D629A|nr:GntR family transcriptional regulator [Dactylosporangium sucinum]